MNKLPAVIAGLATLALLTASSATASPAPARSAESFSGPAAVVSLASASPLAGPQEQSWGSDCFPCLFSAPTGTTYATGSSCAVAQSNLTALLQSLARTQCSPIVLCQLSVVYTVACRLISPGVYRVDGYAKHGCKENVCA